MSEWRCFILMLHLAHIQEKKNRQPLPAIVNTHLTMESNILSSVAHFSCAGLCNLNVSLSSKRLPHIYTSHCQKHETKRRRFHGKKFILESYSYLPVYSFLLNTTNLNKKKQTKQFSFNVIHRSITLSTL